MSAIADVEQIEAPLTFLVANGAPAFSYTHEPPPGVPRRSGEYETHKVAIRDARPIAGEISLDREGFAFRRHASELADFTDDAAIRRIYYPEAEQLIREATGAVAFITFDHTIRNSSLAERAASGLREPASRVHNDYTERSAPQRVRDLLPPAEAAARLKRRYAEYNVWRPIKRTAEAWPLALGDAQTVGEGDLVVSELRYPNRTGETYAVTYNPRQRWYYFPRMRTDEVVLIKCFDSARDGRARLSVHSAFPDPTTPADAPPRESIEVRMFAFF
jgi:hypothetical protein